jgi:hypothetical protein
MSVRTTDQFIDDLRINVAMWADEMLFGHGLDDDAYEQEVETFVAEIEHEVGVTLLGRPVR